MREEAALRRLDRMNVADAVDAATAAADDPGEVRRMTAHRASDPSRDSSATCVGFYGMAPHGIAWHGLALHCMLWYDRL